MRVAYLRRVMPLVMGAAMLLLLASHESLKAQTTFGSITGTVTDPSGSPVPDALVAATNLDTAAKRSMKTGADGIYQFVNLPPGRYRIDAALAGFKTFTRQPVVVSVQATVRIDIPMEIGEVTQTVEVKESTPLLEPESSSLGETIQTRQVNELPLNGRNPMALAALVPSVVPQGQSMTNPNGQNPFAWGNFQIGGGTANQSATWLDGSPVNGGYLNITALIPTQDSLQEFRVQTNNVPAEFGRFAGGIINFDTKSGTNTPHGTLWEFFRNKDLNANNFFDNSAGVSRPAFSQNQFGFNFGAPIYIPKLYNGKNKTFFFVDYEGFRLRQGQSFTETVPTAAERAGDFSGIGNPIYNPLSTCGAAGNPPCATGSNGQPIYTRTPFPGNVIPTSMLNPTSLKMLSLYPQPNAPGLVNNFVTNASVGGNNNETVVRLDQNISDKQHLFARYSYWGNVNLPIDPLRNGVCWDRCTEVFNTNSFIIDDTYTLTPTTILDLRASYQRFSYDRTPNTSGFDVTQFGMPASLNSQVIFHALPVPCITGYDPANIFCSQGAGSVIIDRNDNYRVAGSLTKIHGPHTFKFGGEYLRITHNYLQTNLPTGIFNFNAGFTASSPTTPTGGDGMASFLLGYPSGGNISTPLPVAAQQLYPALYFQDDWKVNQKLTLNLGIRWEYDQPWTERFNRLSYFDPKATNPLLQAAGLNYPGAIELVNSSTRGSRYNQNSDYKQFSPRVGLAYQLTPSTVIRTGYGIFWIPNDVAWNLSPNNDPINSISTPVVSSVNGGLTPATSINNPFPTGVLQPPGRNPSYQQALLGQGVGEAFPSNPYGYYQQWNFDIQQQFKGDMLLDVAYAGSKGTHLPFSGRQVNMLPDQFLSMGESLLTSVANPFYGLVTHGGLAAPTTTAEQLLLPFPQYSGVSMSGSGSADSIYHSLQVQFKKRFAAGATFNVAYTWSKLISDTDTITGWLESGGVAGNQDWNNLNLDHSLTSFDVPQRLVFNYVYDLPFGKGRKFMSSANGAVDAVLGGWGVEGITTLQSGFPLHMTTAQNNAFSYNNGSQRPNVTGGCAESISGAIQDRLGQFFNTGCFSQPAPFTFGNAPRNDPRLRSPGIANWDFSAYKNFRIHESLTLQFRAEFFNIFNRVQFGYPGQTFGTPQFGVISAQDNLPRVVQFALRAFF